MSCYFNDKGLCRYMDNCWNQEYDDVNINLIFCNEPLELKKRDDKND